MNNLLGEDLLLNNNFTEQKVIESICQEYGTPTYIYDLDVVRDTYSKLDKIISWKHKEFHYAMKANYNPHTLKALLEVGASIDTVSPEEVIFAMDVIGFPKEKILFTSNNTTDEDVDTVQERGVLFNIDSLSRLEKYGQKYPNNKVCLRFNPEIVAGEHKHVRTGGDKTKFGIMLNDAVTAKKIADKYGLTIIGVHKHTGSGIAEKEKFFQAVKNLLSVADKNIFPDLEFIDFGGGLKVPYSPDEDRINYDEFGAELDKIFSEHCEKYGKELQLKLEPGKYLSAECGALLIRVNTLKNDRGNTIIAGTDSGFNHLIRPMIYEAYHHIINISNPNGEPKLYDICGNICETGDILARERKIAEIREGDILMILNAGAYAFAMHSIYNLRREPAEVIVEKDSSGKNFKTILSRARKDRDSFIEDLAKQYQL